MNLGEVRKKFIELTGRYDLIKGSIEEPEDNGSDFIINSSQRLLDDMQVTPKSLAWNKIDIASGAVGLQVRGLRYIEEVWIANVNGEVEIDKKSLGWILDNYPTPISALSTGQPIYYAPAVLNLAPAQSHITLAKTGGDDSSDTSNYSGDFTYAFEHIMFVDEASEGYNLMDFDGIVLVPPSDGTYTVSIKGAWYSGELKKDEDVSYWTVQHPGLLIKACMLELEGYNRNSQGYRDLLRVVEDKLYLIDRNIVMQEAAKATQMRG